jgi:hypothetical protein
VFLCAINRHSQPVADFIIVEAGFWNINFSKTYNSRNHYTMFFISINRFDLLGGVQSAIELELNAIYAILVGLSQVQELLAFQASILPPRAVGF